MGRKAAINWNKYKEYINQPVMITLDDHAIGRDIVPCRCLGWLAEITHRKVMIVHWDVLTECQETRDVNIECTSLAKHSITGIKVLKISKT